MHLLVDPSGDVRLGIMPIRVGLSVGRRAFLGRCLTFFGVPLAIGSLERLWSDSVLLHAATNQDASKFAKLTKLRSEWRRLLSPDAYAVLFEEATEPPFSSSLNQEKRRGSYLCSACFLPLFSSRTKFDSGTGWPSFYEPMPRRIATKIDVEIGYPRTEYHCDRCGGHQGHVFDDGPPPTGQRWCNNGIALAFVPEGQPLPPLRT